MATTKLPVSPVLMEIAKLMFKFSLDFSLTWVPRLNNELADALTNGDFSSFVLGNRVPVSWEQVEAAFPVLKDYASHHDSLVSSIQAMKATKRRKTVETAAGNSKRRRKRPEPLEAC